MSDVELIHVSKHFDSVTAVNDISLAVERGEFLTLLGPSGCGKTTTLNMLAGFLTPDQGEIRLAGQVVNHLPPNRRDTALVFQQYALFPHMTVQDNVAFGLKMRKVPKPEIEKRVTRALEVVRLTGYGERRIGQLSGGQQQRVALARAIVVEPTVLLMDEPLSNLDLKLREQLRLEIKHVQQELGLTAIYVTHDQSEALVMSDRIAVMNTGVIEQLGTPSEIYERPATPFVASFIGTSNFLHGTAVGRSDDHVRVELKNGEILETRPSSAGIPSGEVMVAIRPEHLLLSSNGSAPALDGEPFNQLTGRVIEVTYLGSAIRYVVELPTGEAVTVEEPNRDAGARATDGQAVKLCVRVDHCLSMEHGPVAGL